MLGICWEKVLTMMGKIYFRGGKFVKKFVKIPLLIQSKNKFGDF